MTGENNGLDTAGLDMDASPSSPEPQGAASASDPVGAALEGTDESAPQLLQSGALSEDSVEGAGDAGSVGHDGAASAGTEHPDMVDGKVLSLNIGEGLDAAPPSIDPLLDFIIAQLQPVEALGFLRGAIIWITGGMGTENAVASAAEKLDALNAAFQYRLREFRIKTDAAMLAQHDREVMLKHGADEDARKRGFDSSEQMQAELSALYLDVADRLRVWFKSTEPGGDITSAPDTDRLLFDAYRIVEGIAKTERA